ncbi:Toll-interacting protein [Acropora cervicornis]|uniref:Toll-interacting protein n=1 Tax=Acropora cervicornis TaxID=6130 RepID=A0AAD9R4X8_ACRCE|nr:Toll-interacting protein [Acropora cervicornis]
MNDISFISRPVPEGVKEIYVEIFDERAFSMDERIAWGLIPIKEEVFDGETLDDWYSLSGKQGDEKEGMINLVLAYRPVVPGAQVVYPGSYGPCQPVPIAQPPPQLQRRPNQHDIAGLKDMFPNMDESVIHSVLEASGGDVNAATTHLLSMTDS